LRALPLTKLEYQCFVYRNVQEEAGHIEKPQQGQTSWETSGNGRRDERCTLMRMERRNSYRSELHLWMLPLACEQSKQFTCIGENNKYCEAQPGYTTALMLQVSSRSSIPQEDHADGHSLARVGNVLLSSYYGSSSIAATD